MDTNLNILFTNIGRRIYMLEFALDLINQGYPLNIYVNDTSINTAGFWVSDIVKYFITPKVEVDEQKYIDVLLEQCLKKKINIIIPLMDYEIPILALNKKLFAENNIEIIISDYETVMKCLDKKSNYEFCLSNDVKMPNTFFSGIEKNDNFPLILKRVKGSGSKGQKIIHNKKEMAGFQPGRDLMQYYIEGNEYGMDILNDLNGNYLHSFARKKLLMRGGETDKAISVYSERYTRIAKKISRIFRHVGNLDIDFIEDNNGQIYFIDFNPRFGGGYPLTHISGFNYIKALLDIVIGEPVKFPNNKEEKTFLKGISIHSF